MTSGPPSPAPTRTTRHLPSIAAALLLAGMHTAVAGPTNGELLSNFNGIFNTYTSSSESEGGCCSAATSPASTIPATSRRRPPPR